MPPKESAIDGGEQLTRLLDAIRIDGGGQGRVEVEGAVAPEGDRVDRVTVCFTDGGSKSPVSVELCDIAKEGDRFVKRNELSARVTALVFNRAEGKPRMGIRLASLARKGKSEGLWSRVKGGLVNLLIPPIGITPEGNQAMIDLGAALDANSPRFTFPLARNLKPEG